MPTKKAAPKSRKMDHKLLAYKQPYEVASVCRLFKVKKASLLELVKLLPKKHSQKEVYALLLGAGYKKVEKKKATA